MGEKFAANPVTGTGAMTVPIATSPGRGGFGPQLSLSYDSGSGNGAFGFGWSLSIPSITRKTDKGLPQYRDAVESDTFLLSGSEDLVPVLDEDGRRHADPDLDPDHLVERYRPRVEGLFARIERWTHRASGAIHWRSITRDNVTSFYGRDGQSQIFDPDDPSRTFRWLLCRSQDDKGNVIVYEHVGEDDAGVDPRDTNERNRTRTANRYLKRILYGNRTSRLARPDWEADGWLFEVVFDHDEGHLRDLPWDPSIPATRQHHRAQATARPATRWASRPDPFSTYRAGFEVRAHRRCRRVLMFHRFDELTVQAGGEPYLVRATEFDYDDLRYDAPVAIEDELAHPGSTRFASFIRSIRQSGFLLEPGATDTYLRRSLPPLQLEYTKAAIDDTLRELDGDDLENLPVGLDDKAYRWVDLDGEGLSGILAEQGDAWFYKPNLGGGQFGPLRLVPTRPNVRLGSGGHELVDLSGDGRLDVVAFGGPVPGFYQRSRGEDWESFRAFEQIPNLRWDEPNVRLVDLSGDGHADVLVTENEVFTWYRSRGEEGFEPAARVRQPADEERGPRLVLADGTQSIFLADMSGDGMSDLVRIRNGEVCYWPNLGYGRFGGKVTMDDAPWFDNPDQFDEKRIRLADIDGSGATDILYLHRDGVRLHFNQSGNRWTPARHLRVVPPVDDLGAVTTADLLGNGTACLVWSSSLPAAARSPLRYVDLMGGQKPHLLVRTDNNLGLTTELAYAPSTKFYLADKRAGTPWVTKLPFPVHCIERVTVSDRWRGIRFTTSYSYHHGHFDGQDRELRGFGRIEQVDSEHYGAFREGNAASPYITDDLQLYQPPVKTITWFHTGAMLDRRRVLSHFASEYFRHPSFTEHSLPEPDLSSAALTADEWREALRACKGMPLRQEVYELDVDALAAGIHRPVKLFSAANHNCRIDMVQPRAGNRHAVFLVTESEAIRYHYELDLRDPAAAADPRMSHTLTLRVDELGNPLQAAEVVYPRRGRHADPHLPAGAEARIAAVQRELHIGYVENRYTDDIDGPDGYRLRVPCEVTTFEVTGVEPARGTCFELEELRDRLPAAPEHMRLVGQVRTLFFDPNLRDPLPFGSLGDLGLPFEAYQLALTEDLLAGVFTPEQLAAARADLQSPSVSGYASGEALRDRLPDTERQYWIGSGVAGFEPDAAEHFFLPERYTDAFGNPTLLRFDRHDLFVEWSRDPLGNETWVRSYDHRVLAPAVVQDPNDNLAEAVHDILGLPVAMAAMGKGDGTEGDDLGPLRAEVLLAHAAPALAAELFTGAYREPELARLLATATSRQLYWFGETVDPATGVLRYGASLASVCSVVRETHVADLEAGATSALQVAFEYSDGAGNALARKVKAEPAEGSAALRWLTSGKTVVNNKGNPVKQYEPYFGTGEHRFEEPVAVGVTPVTYYDALGRTIRTELPDGSYSRVEFSPWHVTTHDPNDTVLEPGNAWYAARAGRPANDPDRRAAEQAARHAGTPATAFLDSLGREVIAVAHNRFEDRTGAVRDERYVTFTRLDGQGRTLWVRDDRGNLVMQYVLPLKPIRAADEPDPARADDRPAGSVACYDLAGNLLAQHSMDAGGRRMLANAAGQPMYGWDTNVRVTDDGGSVTEDRVFRTVYDAGHRPREHWLHIGDRRWMVERLVYGETLDDADARARNLRGQLHQHHDPSGLVTNHRFDLDGGLEEMSRQLAADVQAPVIDWSEGSPAGQLEPEIFRRHMEYDALSRVVRLFDWHRDPGRVMVHELRYGERGMLAGQDLFSDARRQPSGERTGGRRIGVVSDLRYDAKGRREQVVHGNGTVTRHHHDPVTYRLAEIRTTRPGYRPPFPGHRSGLRDEGVLQQLYYTYDAVGNITQIHDDAYEPVYFRNQRVLPESRYTHDALYRLVRATGRESAAGAHPPVEGREPRAPVATFPVTDQTLRPYTQHYAHDGAGNILEMAHVAPAGSWTRTYEYAVDSNRLLSTRTGNGASSTTRHEYDQHGSMLNLGSAPAELHLRWDYRDMIRSVDLGGGGTAFYSHDAARQRTRKAIYRRGGGVHWERLYLGGVEIYRQYGSGGVTEVIETYHVWVDGARALIVDQVRESRDAGLPTGTLLRYQHGNHLGSASLELDGDAATVSYEEYHPYGTSAYRAAGDGVRATAKRYRYTGMERDEETGLAYHTARYYLPWLGRWASADPIGLGGGPNLFEYAASAPLGMVDVTGHDGDDPSIWTTIWNHTFGRIVRSARQPTRAQRARRAASLVKAVLAMPAVESPHQERTRQDTHVAAEAAAERRGVETRSSRRWPIGSMSLAEVDREIAAQRRGGGRIVIRPRGGGSEGGSPPGGGSQGGGPQGAPPAGGNGVRPGPSSVRPPPGRPPGGRGSSGFTGGAGVLGAVMTALGWAALASSVGMAQTREDRARILNQAAGDAVVAAIAARFLGGPVTMGLFLQSDQGGLSNEAIAAEMAFESAWQEHVAGVTSELASTLSLVIPSLVDLLRIQLIRREQPAGVPMGAELRLTLEQNEQLIQRDLRRLHGDIRASVRQLGREDLPGVRQALVAQGLPRDLVMTVLR